MFIRRLAKNNWYAQRGESVFCSGKETFSNSIQVPGLKSDHQNPIIQSNHSLLSGKHNGHQLMPLMEIGFQILLSMKGEAFNEKIWSKRHFMGY